MWNNPPPAPIRTRVIIPTNTRDQANGSGPVAPLFFEPAEDVDVNPLAALRAVAVGLYAGIVLPPPAVGVASTLGFPDAVCVTCASFGAVEAEGIGAPELANGTTLDPVALKSVCARPIRLLTKSYTTYADRKNVSPNKIGRSPAG